MGVSRQISVTCLKEMFNIVEKLIKVNNTGKHALFSFCSLKPLLHTNITKYKCHKLLTQPSVENSSNLQHSNVMMEIWHLGSFGVFHPFKTKLRLEGPES